MNANSWDFSPLFIWLRLSLSWGLLTAFSSEIGQLRRLFRLFANFTPFVVKAKRKFAVNCHLHEQWFQLTITLIFLFDSLLKFNGMDLVIVHDSIAIKFSKFESVPFWLAKLPLKLIFLKSRGQIRELYQLFIEANELSTMINQMTIKNIFHKWLITLAFREQSFIDLKSQCVIHVSLLWSSENKQCYSKSISRLVIVSLEFSVYYWNHCWKLSAKQRGSAFV